TTSACTACRNLQWRCTPECLFAPYFLPDQPERFANVHNVFGVSNVRKMLNELLVYFHEDCINTLAYEVDMRVKDPIYGCVSVISVLQKRAARTQNHKYLALATPCSSSMFSPGTR
ncbi:hypothetical protein SELMODRAFT_111283, partial [Selaginella moellendorffii]